MSVSIEECARFAHNVNLIYCLVMLGDESQPAWDDATEEHRESCRAGVTAIIEGRVRTPADSHKGWLEQKEKDGWVYGEVKDPDKKEHPCMVPYEELPEEQRLKDSHFINAVRVFMRDLHG